MEITFIMLGSLNHKSSWRSFVKTPMMMLSAYLLFDCKNILMLDATRSPLSDLVPPGSEEDIYSISYRLNKIRRETLLRMFVTDAWREKGEWLASSPAWAALRDNKPGILCWLIITNKTQQQFSQQPGQASLPLSQSLAAPASSFKQRNEFIIHQKGSEQLQSDRGSHNIGISS